MPNTKFFTALKWIRGDGQNQINQIYNMGFIDGSDDLAPYEKQYLRNVTRAQIRGINA